MAMEDDKAFEPVTVLTKRPGQMINVGTTYDAAMFILDEWPPERGGPKLAACKEILLKCLEGECSPAVARVAFIEAAREADIYIPPPENEPVRGKPGGIRRLRCGVVHSDDNQKERRARHARTRGSLRSASLSPSKAS